MESMVTAAEQAGFTLIELMIVIVILAIFVTVGVPSFQNLIKNNRLSAQANRLVLSLQLARSEASKLRENVAVCRSMDGTSCAGAGNWDSGWLVFVDEDTSNDVDATEQVLLIQGALDAGNTLRSNSFPGGVLSYFSTGLSAVNGEFRLCDGGDPDDQKSRTVAISPTGRVSTTRGTNACP